MKAKRSGLRERVLETGETKHAQKETMSVPTESRERHRKREDCIVKSVGAHRRLTLKRLGGVE